MYSFPDNAIWMWENLDSENLKNIIKFTNEFNSHVLGDNNTNYPEEDSRIDMSDPRIKSQIDQVKSKLGI